VVVAGDFGHYSVPPRFSIEGVRDVVHGVQLDPP